MLGVGCLLDRGEEQKITAIALCLISLGWLVAWIAPFNVGLLFIAALLIDPCSSATTVTVQKTVLSSVPMEKRGQINSLNIGLNFLGGTLGATLGPLLMDNVSWACVAVTGLFMTGILLALDMINQTSRRRTHKD